MKRIVSVLAVLVMALGLMCGCAKDDTAKTDSEYVKDKGTLVVGITNFAPMDYKDENGEWIGFDADMAKAFAESLGVKAEFKCNFFQLSQLMVTVGTEYLTDDTHFGKKSFLSFCRGTAADVLPSQETRL